MARPSRSRPTPPRPGAGRTGASNSPCWADRRSADGNGRRDRHLDGACGARGLRDRLGAAQRRRQSRALAPQRPPGGEAPRGAGTARGAAAPARRGRRGRHAPADGLPRVGGRGGSRASQRDGRARRGRAGTARRAHDRRGRGRRRRRGRDRRFHPGDAPRRGRVGGRRGPAARAQGRGLTSASIVAQDGRVKGVCILLLVLGGLVSAAPAAHAADDVRGVIRKVEELRGLRTSRPLAVTPLDAVALRRVVLRLLEQEREPRSYAGWDDALHLLGVLRPGQTLEQVQRSALTGQVAGLYVPRTRRLYVLGSGGSAPRAVVAHEVVHALQDEHFRLTRGRFAPRPRNHDGELAAQALVEGDATEVQSRYIAALSPLDLIGELGRTLRAVPGAGSDATAPFLERQLIFPYTVGQEFVRALRPRGGQ